MLSYFRMYKKHNRVSVRPYNSNDSSQNPLYNTQPFTQAVIIGPMSSEQNSNIGYNYIIFIVFFAAFISMSPWIVQTITAIMNEATKRLIHPAESCAKFATQCMPRSSSVGGLYPSYCGQFNSNSSTMANNNEYSHICVFIFIVSGRWSLIWCRVSLAFPIQSIYVMFRSRRLYRINYFPIFDVEQGIELEKFPIFSEIGKALKMSSQIQAFERYASWSVVLLKPTRTTPSFHAIIAGNKWKSNHIAMNIRASHSVDKPFLARNQSPTRSSKWATLWWRCARLHTWWGWAAHHRERVRLFRLLILLFPFILGDSVSLFSPFMSKKAVCRWIWFVVFLAWVVFQFAFSVSFLLLFHKRN